MSYLLFFYTIIVLFTSTQGMTEVGGIATMQNMSRKSTDSIGFVAPNVQIKFIDLQSGQPLGPNEEGELCLKMENYMRGYYKNPKTTAETIDKDGLYQNLLLFIFKKSNKKFTKKS